ncbi:ycf3-interacting protein 1, chloroplastic isoform X1 [Arachis stenosperma]|uniref:ycf3-interacting protein 1, chloroplastic isoform X1 n=1 Tax=Arachis stenosperma TaxID=217475 RepID=UPI0025AB730E|nr:ycf3-interacting protein 1, chloroplastic isoform X1 [Arachis stenosperma]
MPMASQLFSLTLTPNTLLSSSSSSSYLLQTHSSLFPNSNGPPFTRHLLIHYRRTSSLSFLPFVGNEDTDLRVSTQQQEEEEEEEEEEDEPTPEDLQYVNQIKSVLELLRKNRDMLFGEVKLTIMIEDPREVERRRLLGIEDPDAPTRDDLVAALEEVNEGKVPKDRVALKMLAEELAAWPNLETEAPKKKPSKSLYAKATDTGIDPKVAAKKLNVDWDSAAEIDDVDDDDDTEVPPAVGYGALYLVTAFPVIIGISVVLILFYNSLQ